MTWLVKAVGNCLLSAVLLLWAASWLLKGTTA